MRPDSTTDNPKPDRVRDPIKSSRVYRFEEGEIASVYYELVRRK